MCSRRAKKQMSGFSGTGVNEGEYLDEAVSNFTFKLTFLSN